MSLLKAVIGRLGGRQVVLAQAWSLDLKSPILSAPVTFNDGKEDLIAVGTKDGRLCVFDLMGKQKWVYGLDQKLTKVDLMFMDEDSAKSISSTPVFSSGSLIFGSESGSVSSINLSGKKEWEFKTKGAVRASPLIADINNDGTPEILFGSLDKYMYALNSKGKLAWAFQTDGQIECQPSFLQSTSGNGIVFGTNSGTLYCLSPDGKEKWRFKIKSPITSTPACGKVMGTDEIYIAFGAHDNKMYLLNEKGVKEWEFETNGKIISPAILIDANNDNRLEVCFGSTDDVLYMVSSSGGKLWQFESNFWIASQPIAVSIGAERKEIAIGSYDKTLYLLDAEGEYMLETIPGSSNLTQDLQNYSGLISKAPGEVQGKMLAKYKASGMITGAAAIKKGFVISTSNGKIEAIINE